MSVHMPISHDDSVEVQAPRLRPLRQRLFSRNAAYLLARNTVLSTSIFALNLGILWLLVESFFVPALPAAALAWVAANSFQYAFARSWVFRGTERHFASGYAYYLINAGVGLAVTMVLFAAMLAFTSVHYLVARVVVSVFAGLATFLLNATLNFRRI
jgi:putative flippase GtrA